VRSDSAQAFEIGSVCDRLDLPPEVLLVHPNPREVEQVHEFRIEGHGELHQEVERRILPTALDRPLGFRRHSTSSPRWTVRGTGSRRQCRMFGAGGTQIRKNAGRAVTSGSRE